MAMKTKHNRKSERGSALVYILIAIALLAALTVTFMEPSSQQTSSQSGFRTSAEVKGQIDVIRSSVQECILRYSQGDNSIPNGGGEAEEGARIEYPIDPNSSYLPAASQSGGQLVRDIRCPGNQGGGGANDHQPIFGGNTGKYLQAAPALFGEWQWYNGNDGVFFWIATDNSDAYLRSSLEKLDENYSECEVDIIDNQSSATPLNIDSDGDVSCPANSLCFRVWMINLGTAPHGDFDVDNNCGASQT